MRNVMTIQQIATPLQNGTRKGAKAMSTLLSRLIWFIDWLYFPEDYEHENPRPQKVIIIRRVRAVRQPRKKLTPYQGKSDNLIKISQVYETNSYGL
ncbi:MAG: hypothetical protein OEU76_04285 [Cyclobacteriaceae bacterium]|nr:hypothetical protein [Cyclobacteriaceae bacterium]